MPQAYSYPGVYIEELPSGVRTISGVPTSVVAFVGRAQRGPANDPRIIFSFDEFERQFGGLWPKSSLGYAVRDFYLNSPGGQAVIVRAEVTLEKPLESPLPDPLTDVVKAAMASRDLAASFTDLGLAVVANSTGEWGNALRATIDYARLGDDPTPDPANASAVAAAAAAKANKIFNLTVQLVAKDASGKEVPVAVEVFHAVSTDANNPRRVDKVLAADSKLVRLSGALPPARPTAKADAKATGGQDGSSNLRDADVKKAIGALAKTDIFNLLVIPPIPPPAEPDPGLSGEILAEAIKVATERRAMFLIDPPSNWDEASDVTTKIDKLGDPTPNAAAFFPRIRKKDSTIFEGRTDVDFAPSGAVAGVFARTDAERGVWKAPAGLDAVLRGAPNLSVLLTDGENGLLNPRGINCLRVKTGPARVVWGARTRFGDDDRGDQWKYIPIRRLANFIEESLFRGTQWVVFEPNDEPLWASIRLNVGAFMHSLFRRGAFQGGTPREAYFVKCDSSTTTQDDINRGIVNIIVGFAPLKPAEFVVIKLQQIAGSIET